METLLHNGFSCGSDPHPLGGFGPAVFAENFSNSFTSILLVGGGVHQASPVVCAFLYCQLFQAVSSASTSAALRQGMLLIPLPHILDALLRLGASPLTLPFYVTAKKLIASTRWPPIHASKCRWLPFEFPVVPTIAIFCPLLTFCPART